MALGMILITDEQNLEFYLNVILPGLHFLPTIAKYSIYDREDLIGARGDAHSTFQEVIQSKTNV